MDKTTRKRKRNETTRPSFRQELKEKLGVRCHVCGSDNMVEYHHIIPLALGGPNTINNFLPLCYKCHKAFHTGRHLNDIIKPKNYGGRPRVEKTKAYSVFEKYIGGEIGKKKCQMLLGYSSGTSIVDRAQFKEFMQEQGIKRIRNNVDIVAVNSPDRLIDGCPVGKIFYEDGRTEVMYYKDTGENDVEYEMRGPTWNRE